MTPPAKLHPFEPRTYRQRCRIPELAAFRVVVKETDLWIHARDEHAALVREEVLEQRGYLERWIQQHPEFAETLNPWNLDEPAPSIVTDMAAAGRSASTGPMAAVAGAMAERVAKKLLPYSDAVLVENGGDLFIHYPEPLTVAVAAGPSPLSMRLGIRLENCRQGRAVCTSSGTVGHSFSLGSADAVCVVASSGALADAAATAIGNRVHGDDDIGAAIEFGRRNGDDDIGAAIEFGRRIAGIEGILVIRGRASGAWGDLTLIPLK
jgi:ApbE superfamily uncharacterized protein (UPF0280 family)